MPISPVYNVIFALLIILPMGFIFFSAAFLYNNLCEKKLLSSDESITLNPLKTKKEFLAVLGIGLAISCLFCFLIANDAFDYTLIVFMPPLIVAYLCELKNGFTPLVSIILMAFSVILRLGYYCIFQNASYGLSILLSFALVFALVFIPRFIMKRKNNESFDLMSLISFSLLGSYLSPVYSLIYVICVHLIIISGNILPNYLAAKKQRKSVFTLKLPITVIGGAVFAIMMFI